MRIGLFQFRGSGDIGQNQEAILRGIARAQKHQVRLLAFQECAVCGYPRVEAPLDVTRLDEEAVARCVSLQQCLTCAAKSWPRRRGMPRTCWSMIFRCRRWILACRAG